VIFFWKAVRIHAGLMRGSFKFREVILKRFDLATYELIDIGGKETADAGKWNWRKLWKTLVA
jgi:hypothetical protein